MPAPTAPVVISVFAWFEPGVGPVEMNILTELVLGGQLGRYTATRGWSPAAIEDAARTLRGRGWLAVSRLGKKVLPDSSCSLDN